MYLKRIEVAGFKSFANRTTIQFEDQVTAIVGPNGSGKSNITEAIRWVLGESSAKSLRGGRMPDIIFAGSESRKPLNIAEVTIVLDNSDNYLPIEYTEVSVTRRLRRTGESDFFLNKQACRLRDIQELFMDSGLGKESFSIISQGKVEAIFSSKPEDRRGIFEEAAGVLKYKTRKKQAEAKLNETQDNLHRVQDIVYELEEQLAPLREQKETAQAYVKLKEELTGVDVAYTVQEVVKAKQSSDEIQLRLQDAAEKLEDLQDAILQKEELLLRARSEREQLDEALEAGNQELVSLVETLKQAEGKQEVLAERSKHTLKSSQEYQELLADVEEKLDALEDQKSTQIAQLSQQNGELQMLDKQLKQTQQELSKYEKSTKELVEELRGQYVEWMQKQANVSNERKYLERQYQQETYKNQQNATDQQHYRQVLTEKEALLAELTEKITQERNALQVQRTEYSQLQATSKETQQKLLVAQKQMYQLMSELQQAKARQKSLQDLQENYTGYYQGVRIALQHRQQLSGILGAVAELIQVPAEYTLAIETALGGAMQHIVVRDEQDARQAITFLKERKAGRATFLPLTTIKARTLPEAVQQQAQGLQGFVGIASELLAYEAELTNVVRHLMGTVLIAEDLTSANRIARIFQFRYRVVSLEGDVMNAGGSMTGGANKRQQQTLFSQGKELEQLNQLVSQRDSQLQVTEAYVQELQALLNTTNQALEDGRQSGTERQSQEQEWVSQKQVLQAEVERLKKDQQIAQYEWREWQTFLAEYEEKNEAFAKEQIEIQETLTRIQLDIQTLNEEEDGIEIRRQTVRQELAALQAKTAVTKEKVSHLQQAIFQLDETIQEQQQRQATLERQLAALSLDDSDQEVTSETLRAQVLTLQANKQNVQQELQEKREQRYQLHEQIRKQDDTLAQAYREQKEVLGKQKQAEIENNRLMVTIDNRAHYLEETYQLSVDQALYQYGQHVIADDAQQVIQQLKQKITHLGPINLQAIDQFEQVNERYEFLTTQLDDLLDAKEQLCATMDEMDEEVEQRFSEVFYAIREQFQQVFPNMFGGGKAELLFTNPDDLLNTGIEIEAQPPGKKLQNLSLLSGGERALTAIALLFAIIQVRPVPFCILDEVEAALDEANVVRFGRYLQSEHHHTQFIVVTHRKGTMGAADVLYGVTMEESGVSKVLSVRLEDVKEDGKITKKGVTND